MEVEVSIIPDKVLRAQALLRSFHAKQEGYLNKSSKARKEKLKEQYDDLHRKYYWLINRAYQLERSLVDPVDAGYLPWRARIDYKARENRKAAGFLKFQTRHTFSALYMSRSLSADYGTFVCDKCGTTFHHSPSIIKQALKEIYHCCCGSCTNKIIHSDWNEVPFSA